VKKNKKNTFKGFVKHKDSDDIIYELDGICSDILEYSTPNDEKIVLIDMSSTEEKYVFYPQGDQVPELNSLKVWKSVNDSIVDNDMKKADQEKKNVEKDQRNRLTEKKRKRNGRCG